MTESNGYMTLPGPSVPGRQFLDRHSNPNPNPDPNPDPNPIPNPVQELTVQELTVQELTWYWEGPL